MRLDRVARLLADLKEIKPEIDGRNVWLADDIGSAIAWLESLTNVDLDEIGLAVGNAQAVLRTAEEWCDGQDRERSDSTP